MTYGHGITNRVKNHLLPRIILPLITAALLYGSALFAAVPGVTPGEFSVDQNGAANYAVPINVPPGTAGMHPALSLNYSSRSGQSLLGLGWSLGGLSQVTRCPATQVQDGFIDGVDFDANDRFCVDGQRLIAIAGEYGADGTEYRTEIDSLTKVISYDTDSGNSGPKQFKVWTKSGQIMEYGFTDDSRIEVQNSASVRLWAVNKISDAAGNYLNFSYYEDNVNGESYPLRIDYTGNELAGLNPYNSVRFTYEPRLHSVTSFIDGAKVQLTQQLTTIAIYADDTRAWEYRLSYLQNNSFQPQLGSVQECDNQGNCLSPTSFSWKNPETPTSLSLAHSQQSYPSDGSLWRSGITDDIPIDLNGDGLTDLIQNSSGGEKYHAMISNGDGSFTETHVIHNVLGRATALVSYVVELNGDGLADILQISGGGEKYLSFISNGDGTFNHVQTGYSVFWRAGPTNAYPADINGDGLTDFYQLSGGGEKYQALQSNGDGSFTQIHLELDMTWSESEATTYPVEINGDGITDLLQIKTGSYAYQALVGLGDGRFEKVYEQFPGNGGVWRTGSGQTVILDFNGDGLHDIVQFSSYGSKYHTMRANGDGSFTEVQLVLDVIWQESTTKTYPADLNADGLTDLLQIDKNQNRYQTLLSDGEGRFIPDNSSGDDGIWNADSGNSILIDLNGDGASDLLQIKSGAYEAQSLILSSYAPQTIKTITNGLGATTHINYKPFTDSSVYTKGENAETPLIDVQFPMYVVASVQVDDGIGGFRETAYHYEGAVVDTTGRGFLGFAQMRSTDTSTNITTTTTYRQDFPFTGMIEGTQTRLQDGTLIGETTSTYTLQEVHDGVFMPYADKVIKKSYELDGSLVTITTTDNVFDEYANATYILISTTNHDGSEVFTTRTLNTYNNDTSQWHLGRLTRTEVTKTTSNGQSATRTSAFTYNANGLLDSETIEPDIPALTQATLYEFDLYGNKTGVTLSGAGLTSRTSQSIYDLRGQFVIQAINALGHSETRAWDAARGKMFSLTGPNGLTTAWAFDSFGRQVLETRADGTSTTITRQWCNGFLGHVGSLNCPANGALAITTQSAGAAPATAYSDRLGRTIRQEATGFDGTAIYVDTLYDHLGQVSQKSRPYFVGDAPLWHSMTYDISGRVYQENSPDGSYTRFIYDGLLTCTHNDLGQLNYHTKNVVGDLVHVKDTLGHETTYDYDPFNNLTRVTDDQGNITTNSFDLRGRKIAMNDPDMGAWQYQYNTLGELISQTDAKGQTVTMEYDLLGRMVKRTESEGISTWVYDSAQNGIGKLHSVSGTEGDYKEYKYDALSRQYETLTTIDGQTYKTANTFDAFSRTDQLIYPASAAYPSGFALKHIYNQHGYLLEVRDASNNEVFWQAQAQNAEGQLTQSLYGNGITTGKYFNPETGLINAIYTHLSGLNVIQDDAYEWDGIGNLTQREDRLNTTSEDFIYDDINRLIQSSVGNDIKTYAYDSIGNITFKTGMGNYTYGSAKPHAVTEVSGHTMSYDANGNMLTGWNFTKNETRTTHWTSYNKPSQISQGSVSLQFSYGADRARFKQINSNGKTTLYVGGIYEKEITANETTHVYYIRAGGETIAIHKAKENASGQAIEENTRYLHKDHIGSITVITDETAQVIERFAYDPHGKRRNVIDWSDALTQITAIETKRSFTGHEYLEDVGVIHMNGRVYDPDLGRFLSPDPIVQQVDNPQNLNRYSYVLNNPLSATDPSGFLFGFVKKVFKKVFGAIKKLYRNEIFQAVGTIAAAIACGPPCAAVASGVNTAINGGSPGDIIKSAAITFATAYAFHQVGHGSIGDALGTTGEVAFMRGAHIIKTLAHGTVGGLSSIASGGKFLHGFLAAGAAQFAAPGINGIDTGTAGVSVPRTIASAVVGGTSSVLGGGKFANGAVTGAFSRMYNDDWIEGIIKERLTSDFEKDLFSRYWSGEGDLNLSEEQFGKIIGVIKPSSILEVSKIVKNQTVYYEASVSFYSNSNFDQALGVATVYYTIGNGKAIPRGLYDYYDLDSKPWGTRPFGKEIQTRSASSAGWLYGAKPYSICYKVGCK